MQQKCVAIFSHKTLLLGKAVKILRQTVKKPENKIRLKYICLFTFRNLTICLATNFKKGGFV